MNGAHDMGGMHGFGPVLQEKDEPWFHGEWEKKAFALTLACGGLGQWNIDISRHARENQPPAQYLDNSYYEQWLHGLEVLLVEAGLVTEDELKTGKANGKSNVAALPADRVFKALQQGSPYAREIAEAPAFKPGDKVRVKSMNPPGHTRAPQYVRGHVGEVVMHHGAHVFADASARGEHGVAHHIYNVAFTAEELWGADGQGGAVHLDLWEPYLERAR
jgi:nitrile hydratase subunit beta